MLAEDSFDLLHGVVGLQHHAGRLGVVALYVLVYLCVVFHEHPHESFQQTLK